MINFDEWDMETLMIGFLGAACVLAASVLYLMRLERKGNEERIDAEMEEVTEELEEPIPAGETKRQRQQRLNEQRKSGKEKAYDHPWYVTTLKGHTSPVVDVDFAPDGKKFVSISSDRSVFFWDVRDFEEREHKCSRQKLDFDTPTHVSFAPDSKSVLFSVSRDNKLVVFKLTKGKAGNWAMVNADIDYPSSHPKDISCIGFAGNAKYVMSASPDTKIAIHDIRGDVLKVIEAKVSQLYDCRISPDGRFISAAGFSPDCFVYEPVFGKDKSFTDAKKVFALTGHGAGVFAAAFNTACTRAVTISRDGLWRVFDTDIRYVAGQDAKVLRQGEWREFLNPTSKNVSLALSPSGESFAVAVGSTLKIFSSEDEKADFPALTDLHTAPITSIRFSPDGKYIATCGDKFVRIIENIPLHHSIVVRCSRELPEVTNDGAKRRLKEQIEEAQAELKKYGLA
ncbi:unnamed protein product [Caenorhabditis auriculariae]|uniref:Uncharacterized protein n=1 Tax=Caenorhabditis auriculariae TaxID=2777116 RepID=A0A8S1H7K8_9PELO|nr:unnamed protein product [Caenorhabditis auriculariae]